MNDISQLTSQLAQFLAPFLPYLLKMGEKAAEEAGKKLGAEAWERAKALWGRLRPKVESKPAAREAVEDAAAAPQDEDALAALRLQLKKLLAEDPALATEIARLWGEAQAAGVTVAASGDRSVAIGGFLAHLEQIWQERRQELNQLGCQLRDIVHRDLLAYVCCRLQPGLRPPAAHIVDSHSHFIKRASQPIYSNLGH